MFISFQIQSKMVKLWQSSLIAGPSNTDYGSVLLGILIMQDVFLGVLMALLPNMATAGKNQKFSEVGQQSLVTLYGWIALRLLIGNVTTVDCMC